MRSVGGFSKAKQSRFRLLPGGRRGEARRGERIEATALFVPNDANFVRFFEALRPAAAAACLRRRHRSCFVVGHVPFRRGGAGLASSQRARREMHAGLGQEFLKGRADFKFVLRTREQARR